MTGAAGDPAGPPGTVRLVVARVGRAHGIRGEVTVALRTDAPDTRLVPGARLFTPTGTLRVATARDHNGVLLLRFEEAADRTAAEALRGVELSVDVDPAAEREADAWFDHELVGLTVLDPGGTVRGRVVGVEHLPAQDLLEVEAGDGVRRLVPLVAALVPTVDVEAGHVVVDAPPGLLDDGD